MMSLLLRRKSTRFISYNHQTFNKSLISSTPKLCFSASSNARNVKHNSRIHPLYDPTNVTSLNQVKALHAIVITMGSFPTQKPIFLQNNIISKYASLGDIVMARKLFDEMPQRNVVSYNTMITCCSRAGFLQEGLELFSVMRKYGFKPTQFTFGGLLSCHCLDAFEGMQLHALIEKTGFLHIDAFAGTALLGMYRMHVCLDECIAIFKVMPKKNSATWNSMISIFGQMGYIKDCILMFSELMMEPDRISEYTFINLLSSLEDVDVRFGKQIHGLVIKYGLDNVASVCNCLINMYAKSAATCLAEKMFGYAPVKDIVSWNTLIGSMANSDSPTKAIDAFKKMCMTRLSLKETTFANLLKSCSKLKNLSCGKCVHAKMIKTRFECNVYAGSALVNFYSKCDKVQEAHTCFEAITQKNLVCWNSLLLGYSNTGSPSSSIRLLKEMIHSGYYPNELSFSIVIKSSLKTELLQLHSLTMKMGYHENPYVSSSLISSYAKNDLVLDALVFVGSGNTTKLPVVSSNIVGWIYNRTGQYEKTQELYADLENPDSISWNILIAACSRNGDYKETFELFDHMRRSRHVSPDNYTFASLFSVCIRLCNLALGSSLHGLLVKIDFKLCDTLVCNTMIDMYGKCGCINSSITIFNEVKEKNIISWTALVSALGLHGYGNEALDRFREMVEMGIEPDKVAFLAVLSACRHVGLVEQGMDLFGQMKPKYGVEPDIDHYLAAVDLLTRYGRIKEAEQLILTMPVAPNVQIWRVFLDGSAGRSPGDFRKTGDDTGCQESWKGIVIDEFQDTSTMQYGLLQILASHKCITVVGDEDQSIFSFNGADACGLDSFRKYFPMYKEVILNKNYRSTCCIVDAASFLIRNNLKQCISKDVVTDNSSGSKVLEIASDGSSVKKARMTTLLYSTGGNREIFQTAFRDRKIPFNIHGVAFYRKKLLCIGT
ncbi:hypothetical protein OROMI_007289 [Orobanche minor]